MSTQANPVSDPYAAFGGSIAAPKEQQGADPYAAFGGSVAKAHPAAVAPLAPASRADAYGGPAFQRAVRHRMQAYGEPQTVAERHVRGERPELVAHPELAKPASIGHQVAEAAEHGAEFTFGVNPEVTKRALAQAEGKPGGLTALIEGKPQPTLRSRATGTLEYLTSGVPFGGAPLAQAMEESGKGQYKQAAIHTAEAIPQLAMLPLAEEKVVSNLVGEGAGEYLPEAQRALLKSGQATLKRAPETAAQAVARPAEQAAGDVYQEYGGHAVEPGAETRPVEPTATEPTIPAETGQRILSNTETLRQLVDPDRIQSEADVERVLDEAGLQHNPELRTGNVVPFEQQRELAHNLGMTPDELLNMKGAQAMNAEQLLAARALTTASRDETMNLARLAATGDKDYEQRFLEALARHQEIADSLRARMSEAGRALGSLRNAPEPRTVGDAVAALSNLDDKARLEAAKRLVSLDPNDTPAIEKFIRQITPKSTWDKINEYWINAILSGGTSVKKAAADTAMRILGVAERPTAAALDAMRALVTGTGRTRYFGETGADVYGMFRAMPRALSQFWSTFAHDQGFDQVLDPLSGGRAYVPSIKGTLGEIVRTPTRLLESITDAAQVVNYSAELHAEAYRQAAREGLHGAALLDRAGEIAGKAFGDPDDEMSRAAYDYARRRTFTQELGKTGKAISSLTHRPGIRYVVPFARIPINIMKAGIEYSPAGLLRSQTPETAARAVIGTALSAAFLRHALDGEITGSGAELTPSERLRLEAKGWQPDSIRIGNRYYSYRYLEPIAPVLGMAADLAKAVKDKRRGEIQDISKQMSKSVAAQLQNLPFLSSLLFLNHALENPQKYAGNFGASFIPTALADVARMADRTVRTPKTLGQQFENRIPGETGNVPALLAPAAPPGVRNVYHLEGPALVRPGNALGGFNPFPSYRALPGLGEMQRDIGAARRARTRRQLERRRLPLGVGLGSTQLGPGPGAIR